MKALHQRTKTIPLPESAGFGKQRKLKAVVQMTCFPNQRPYFSVTGEVFHPRAKDIDAGGCLHDLIEAKFPELKPLLSMHLRDDTGAPAHAIENACYFIQAGDVEALAKHLRISISHAQGLITDTINIGKEARKAIVSNLIDWEAPKWQREAEEALKLLTDGLSSYSRN